MIVTDAAPAAVEVVETLSSTVRASVTPTEKLSIQAAAAAAGVSVSAFARRALLNQL